MSPGYTPEEKRRVLGRVVGAGLVLALCVTCVGWRLHDMMWYDVEDYKPDFMVETLSDDSLSQRFAPFPYQEATVLLEWFTYDNETINQSPYKLLVVLEPKVQGVRLELDSIAVSSTAGDTYSFSGAIAWPVVIEPAPGSSRGAYTFEPAFDFDFDAGEVVRTRIWWRFVTEEATRPEFLDIRWVPILTERWTSIV